MNQEIKENEIDKDLQTNSENNIIDDNTVHIDEEEEDRRHNIWIFFVIALLLLIFIIIGFTYSFFDNSISGGKQPIDTDANVIFNYTDTASQGNGIHLKNVNAMSDTVGKKLTGENNVFDFNVSGRTWKTKTKYYVVVEKDIASTMSSEDVKIYLTKKAGTVEVPLMDNVPTVDSLKDITIKGVEYKVLYERVLPFYNKFSDSYTLRMWVKEGSTTFYGKNYSLRINIFAEGIGE